MASILLWVVTCICTPAMAKGVIESARPFRLLDRSAGRLFTRRSGESAAILTRRDRSGQPLSGWSRSGPNYRGAMVSKALTPPGVDGCSLYGVSRVGAEAEAKNGQRPRGGPGPLSRALKKSRQREGLL